MSYKVTVRRLGYHANELRWDARTSGRDTMYISLVPAEGYVCSAILRPAIEVEVRDSTTGAPIAGLASGVVEDAGYRDTLRVSEYEDSTAVTLQAALERGGTYAVALQAPGYRPWLTREVRVDRGRCHVNTVRLFARLQRVR